MSSFRHVLVLFMFLCLGYAAKKFPSYIQKCHINDTQIEVCFRKAIDDLKPHLVKGVPEFKIPSMDPLIFPLAMLSNGNDFNATFTNIEVYHALSFRLEDLKVDLPHNHIELRLTFPKLRIKTHYHLHGRILIFRLDGEGPSDGNFTNVEANLVLYGSRYRKGGKEYLQFDNKSMKLKLGKPVFQFDNIFAGNEDLNVQTNRILNENVVDIIEELRPVIDQTVTNFIFALVGRIFTRFSMDELFIY